jgi:alkyl hydroperoxide reductase subunit AhpC
MPGLTINDKFPNLKGSTQDTDSFDLYEYLDNSWGLVFMHPGDFTPVCTTELAASSRLDAEWQKRGVKVCGFSCNDADSHRAWIKDIKAATGADVKFPLFCDPNRDHATAIGVLDETNRDKAGLPLTVRSVFVVKPDKTIALMMTYPASSGRNFDEILRAVDTCQLTAKHSVATPADWTPGDKVIVNFPLTDAQATEKFGEGSYTIVDVPSEKGKDLPKHYLRFLPDPVNKKKETSFLGKIIGKKAQASQ